MMLTATQAATLLGLNPRYGDVRLISSPLSARSTARATGQDDAHHPLEAPESPQVGRIPSHKAPLVSLQIGRGLAALAVAAFHLAALMQAPAFGGGPIPWLSAFDYGWLGVDFFFVLSGFIILHAHEADVGNGARLGRYAYRRVARIFPIYWLYLALCIAGMIAVKSVHFQLSTGADWASVLSLVRFSTVELPLAQAWTLFHEVLFYAMFALLIVNRRAGLIALAVWFGCIALIGTRHGGAGESFSQVVTSSANLNFLAGMLAYKATQRINKAEAATALFVGLGLLLAGMWQYGIAFALILAGAAVLEGKLPRWLGYVGDASYSIYLLHEHIETYSARALSLVSITPTTYPVTMFALVLIAVLIGGCAAYALVEKPMTSALRRWEPRR